MYTTDLNTQHLLQGKPWAPDTQLMNSIKPRRVTCQKLQPRFTATVVLLRGLELSLKRDPKAVVVQVVK